MKNLPDRISVEDIRDMRMQNACRSITEYMNTNPQYLNFLSNFETHGVDILSEDKKLYFRPIQNLRVLLEANGLSGNVEHIGVMRDRHGTFDNQNQLKSIGIFGKTELSMPTYIRPLELATLPSSIRNNYQDEIVRMLINPDKLVNRTIIVDPEMYVFNVFQLVNIYLEAGFSYKDVLRFRENIGEVPLGSFMIMGGIPQEAIMSINKFNREN